MGLEVFFMVMSSCISKRRFPATGCGSPGFGPVPQGCSSGGVGGIVVVECVNHGAPLFLSDDFRLEEPGG